VGSTFGNFTTLPWSFPISLSYSHSFSEHMVVDELVDDVELVVDELVNDAELVVDELVVGSTSL